MFNFVAQVESHISIDCIKVCPYQSNLFAFAYYQTNPTTLGAIAVATINEAADISSIQTVECPPLLHIVWSRSLQDQNIYIIAASSRNNQVFFYHYNTHNGSLTLASTLVVGEVFCLYLDIVTLQNRYHLTVSTNESTVTSFILDVNLVLQKKVYSKHQYAVWTCRVSPIQKEMFVCGDEVDTIYMYAQGNLIAKNSTAHKGGICDLTFDKQYALYSGGFDGIVCAFDTRKMKQHVYRHEWGGTIWRVVPNKSDILLCNSSQKKFQIVNDQLNVQKWSSGNSNQSLAYAADWGQNMLLTASFYDRKLSFWQRSKE